MTIYVSRGTLYNSAGQKICGKCGLRPRRPGQRTCQPCHTEYMRDWRKRQPKEAIKPRMLKVSLSRGEWEAVKAARAAGWPIGGLADD